MLLILVRLYKLLGERKISERAQLVECELDNGDLDLCAPQGN